MALERFSTRKSLFLFYPCLEVLVPSGFPGTSAPLQQGKSRIHPIGQASVLTMKNCIFRVFELSNRNVQREKTFIFLVSILMIFDFCHCFNIMKMITTKKRKLIWMYISTLYHNQVLIFLNFINLSVRNS